jgi:hypothetical protein
MTRFLLSILALFLVPSVAGQSTPLGAWSGASVSAPISGSPYALDGEVQARYAAIRPTDLAEWRVRAGASRSLADGATRLGVGYLFNRSESDDPAVFATEHRIHQEATLRQRILSSVGVAHRFRVEQRFQEGANLEVRYRYRVQLTLPLTASASGAGSAYAAASSEIFLVGFGRNGGDVFNRARINGSLGYRLTDDTSVSLGYQNEIYEDETLKHVLVSIRQSIAL